MAFRYRVRKMAVGSNPYTTRPDLGTPLSEEEVVNQLEAVSSISRGDILSMFANLRGVLVGAARETRPSETLFGLIRMGLSCGGALNDPEDSISRGELDPRLQLYAASGIQTQFVSDLDLERTGIDGDKVPVIDLVRNDLTGDLDSFTDGDAIEIKGDNLKLDEGDAAQGVFFIPTEGGPDVRADRYFDNSPGTLRVRVPGSVSGNQQVRVTVKIGQNERSTVYTNTLIQEVAPV